MEKFAVDLDKVLDEFEFNEDCAEQVASSSDSDKPTALSPTKPSLQASSDFTRPIGDSSMYGDRNSVSGKNCDSRRSKEKSSNIGVARSTDETPDIRKVETKRENSESINDFYNRGRTPDEKVQQKRYMDFGDGEPVSLTIRNDISQKFAQKRHNENVVTGTKNHNSYDKKFNQSNAKPSVSNVFSSLNEYINAPSGSVEHSDDRRDMTNSKVDNTLCIGGKNDRTLVDEESVSVASNSGYENTCDESGTSAIEEIANVKKCLNSSAARYENILLPVKYETAAPSSSKTDVREKRILPETTNSVVAVGGNSEISFNSGGTSVISGGVSVSSGVISINSGVSVDLGCSDTDAMRSAVAESNLPSGSSKYTKSTESQASRAEERVEHVYENVYITSDVQSVREIYATVSKPNTAYRSYEDKEAKHVYENVDFDVKASDTDDKEGAYERIFIGQSSSISEISIEQDNAAKPVKKSAGETDNATLKSFNSNGSMTERKHVVGFSTIDDLSEEELKKYLADLEAEERTIEGKAMYENISYTEPTRDDGIMRHGRNHEDDDEDANEAPIFETVMIGELPTVSEKKLQEKAKKFPVIDYSRQKGSFGVKVDARLGDFLEKNGPEKSHAPARFISEARVRERRSKKLADRNNRSSEEISDTVSQTGTENQGSIERSLPADDTTVSNISTVEPVENHSHDINHRSISENNISADDLASRTTESRENKADGVDLECPSEDSTDAPASFRADLETCTEASKVNCATREDAQSNISGVNNAVEACNKSRDENGSSGLPASSENGFGNSEELNQNSEEDVEDKPPRPQTLDIVSTVSMDDDTTTGSPGAATPGTRELPETEGNAPQESRDPSPDASDNSSMESGVILGKQPPFWIPDSDAPNCMLCDVKFNVIKRRHHCRACGKVLCNKCCSMKYRLEYQGNIDSRVCGPCYQLLIKAEQEHGSGDWSSSYVNNSTNSVNSPQGRQPNPNNPMEYCSTIPPLQQLAGGLPPPPTVMVPVGVLKREGSSKQRPEGQKSVMFSDGIRPGCDLTELDTSWDLKPPYRKIGNKRTPTPGQTSSSGAAKRQNMPPLDPNTNSYIPQDPDILPPTVTIHKGQISYHEVTDSAALYKSLKNDCEPPVMFAINRNLYAYVKITNLNCCVNRICWNITSRGLACVGQDEIILLVETLPDETQIPKDLLVHINQIYVEAIKGNTITELGVSIHQGGNFLGSREHAGFLFIRQTFQCLQKIVLPPAPFLVGLLVHRWETPWAKVFPLRLVLRLGAEYRYYPCPLVSVRFRDAVYFEIGHTIMKVLADFRNFAYTLPGVRGLTIHMQDRTTDVLFPKNRYDQVIKGLNNSNDHVLAFASNFSVQADSHLVCIQTNTGDESNYQTQAINIHNKPRKVTGASFVVINGALKSSMGLSAKSSIVEDGLMVQIMPEKMEALKAALKNMQDFSIGCGLQGAPEPDETVNVKWVDNDVQFNLGVKSPIDGTAMDGVPSIRVHNGTDYMGTSRFIRWTEVFIIKSDDHPTGVHDPVDINKLSESIARATCAALVKLLDLLATAGLTKLAVRTTSHSDNVGYEAGSEGTRLPPIYMNSLDNELIQVLHKAAQSSQDTNTVLELIFHVLDD